LKAREMRRRKRRASPDFLIDGDGINNHFNVHLLISCT